MANYSCDQNAAVRDLCTLRDFLRWAVTQFEQAGVYYGHGTDNAWDEACALVLGTLHLPWDVNTQVMDARLTGEERNRLAAQIAARTEQRMPVPYLTGEAWFAGLPFYVSTDVLIPRSPLAELIDRQVSPWVQAEAVGRVLDLCTGSGCIGIAAAMAFPGAAVDLADISSAALAIAKRNIARHDCAGRVETIAGDLFSALDGRRYDLILSNPPYVDAADLASMPAEYQHEPRLALQADEDGLRFARRILAEAASFLNPDGVLVLEVGNSAEALAAAYPKVPFFWFDFEHGGEGVCLLTTEQLLEHQDAFAASVVGGA